MPLAQDVVDHRLADDLGKVLVDQQPLVVPQRDLAGDEEREVAVRHGQPPSADGKPLEVDAAELVDHAVVEQDVGAVQAGDHHVLVVAGIAEQRAVGAVAVRDPGHVLVHAAGTDLELRPDGAVRVRHVEVGTEPGTAAEHRVQVERRRSGVGRHQRVLGHPSWTSDRR